MMRLNARVLRFVQATILFGTGALIGCIGSADGPSVAPVSGMLTVGGKPRADVSVVFQPEAGGRPAQGVTDAEGRFTLSTFNTGDGAIVGTHNVGLGAGGTDDAAPPMPGFPGFDEWQKKQREKIDPKYADPKKSGLVYTVPSEGLENVEIKLP